MAEGTTMTAAEMKAKWIKTARWIYWTMTLVVVAFMVTAGVWSLTTPEATINGLTHFGYPAYLYKILGVVKLLTALAILPPRLSTFKEWGYAVAVFQFLLESASHACTDHSVGLIAGPLVLILLLLMSHRQWKTRWM